MFEDLRPHEFRRRLAERLTQDGFYLYEAVVGRFQCTVGRKTIVSWKWLWRPATFFVFVAPTVKVDAGTLQLFAQDCLAHALENKPGVPRPLGSAIALAVLAGDHVLDVGLKEYLDGELGDRVAAFPYPIAVNARSNEIFQRTAPPARGRSYTSVARDIVQRDLLPALPPRFVAKGAPAPTASPPKRTRPSG